jgi:hypothetical protein
MGKGFIRRSTSEFNAPILVVKKPGGGLRICVNYQGLNSVTQKNQNAPPSIRKTLSRLCKVRIITILDVITAFNNIQIKEGDKYKTAFLTRYRLFEICVMPFGLTNSPATFQSYINKTLREYLDDFCTAYLDNVLIYSKNKDKHDSHVEKVIQRLGKASLYLNINKSQFGVKRVKYLSLILSTDRLKIDPKKIRTVVD